MKTKKWDLDHPDEVRKYRREYYYRNQATQLERVQARKYEVRRWFQAYKATLRCERCDENRPPCLDFHHAGVDEKTDIVSKMVHDGFGKERILQEIEKCIVLCANCHRAEHAIGVV